MELVDAERHLEAWAEADPSLLADGLVVVGRQVQFEGGPADLLAIDSAGRWVIVEIKRAANHRQDLAQAMDYAASLRHEPAEQLRTRLFTALRGKPYEAAARIQIDAALADEAEGPREVAIMLAGLGLHAGAERVLSLLAEHGLDVRAVNFSAHRSAEGAIVLARDIEEESPQIEEVAESESASMEALLDRADSYGCGDEFREWLEIAEGAGLFTRAYKHSVMLAPPQHHNAYLAVCRPLKGGRLRINHGPAEFAQWFPWFTTEEAEAAMGPAERGMGKVLAGQDLKEYLLRFRQFAQVLSSPPEEYQDITSRTAQWDRERFLSVFATRPHEAEIVEAFLDSVQPSGEFRFERAPLGQVRLRYSPDAPHVIQLNGRSRLYGLWAMGDAPAEHPGWKPLKEVLRRHHGVGATGGARGIILHTLTRDDVDEIVRAAVETSQALVEP